MILIPAQTPETAPVTMLSPRAVALRARLHAWHIAIALLIGFFSCAASATTIDEEAFTRQVAARLQALHPELRIEALRPLEIRYGAGEAAGGHVAYLANAYQRYRNGEELAEVVEAYASATVKSLDVVAPNLDNIVPVIKDERYVREVSAALIADMGAEPDQGLYAAPYSEGLVILYAVDTPRAIQYLSRKDFRALSLPEPELRASAVANLTRLLPELTLHHHEDLYMFTAGGSYESSLLLLDAVWNRLAERIRGRMVVGIPSRDVLLVADSANRDALQRLGDTVREIHATGAYSLTPDLYERVDGGWRKLAGKTPGKN